MTNEKHLIWSSSPDYADWKEDLEEQYPDLTEDERISLMYEINGDYLNDERVNLNIQLSRPILVVGDLGLWNHHISIYVKSPHGARLRTVVCARCSGERHSRVGGVQQHQPFQRRLPKKVWMHSERI